MRVRVAYASVNPADWKAHPGMVDKYINYQFPLVLRFDLAGTIDAIGADVTRFAVGDSVFGTSRQSQGANGSHAEYSIADEAMLQFIPARLSLVEAASLPMAGATAIRGLLDVGKLKTDQTVLINGGAGGVGSIAIQIAHAVGARMLTTCSAGNADYVRGLGGMPSSTITAATWLQRWASYPLAAAADIHCQRTDPYVGGSMTGCTLSSADWDRECLHR